MMKINPSKYYEDNCKLENGQKCLSTGKYTPTGIRGMVAPKLALDANIAMSIVRMKCTAVRFRAVCVERQAISTFR